MALGMPQIQVYYVLNHRRFTHKTITNKGNPDESI
jgi:hypothetical protein